MDSTFEQLHFFYVEQPHLDAFPDETQKLQPLMDALTPEQSDAYERLLNNASLTSFEAGFRLGLALGLALPPSP